MTDRIRLISEHLVPVVAQAFKDLMMLMVSKDFQTIVERYPIGLSSEAFQEVVEDWMGKDAVAMPPDNAFEDFEYDRGELEFNSSSETVPRGRAHHAIQITGFDEPSDVLVCHMYMWHVRDGRTDVSLILQTTDPLLKPFKVLEIDMEVM